MKKSIRVKIAILSISFAAFVVATTWIICNYLVSSVFIMQVERNLEVTFESCNQLYCQKGMVDSDTGELLGKVKNPGDANIYVLDFVNRNQYSYVHDKTTREDSIDSMIESLVLEGNSMKYIRGKYVFSMHHDDVSNADYYDLVGTLDNGAAIVLRVPFARIESTMKAVNHLFLYVSFGILIVGSAFILLLSNVFAKPLKRLAHAARQMSNLDFNVRVPVVSKDEIGELGIAMNVMSDRLQRTLSELKFANIRLEKDIQQKQQIDEMRKEFLSHVSHELKTPIALIQGYAEGLKDNLFDDPESQQFYTEVIIDEAQKMNSMVKKLLELNELEFGNNPISIERFDVTEMISDIITSSSILASEVEANVVFEEQPVYVWADEFMISEVFTNYFTNAIHYVTQGGTIRIWYTQVGGNIRVNVFNEGNHIADEDIDKLFIKFYKADKARTREYGGNGIGLSIVAAIMDAHAKAYGVSNVENGVVFYFDLDANLSANSLEETTN